MLRSARALLAFAAGLAVMAGAGAHAAEAPAFPVFPPAGDQDAVIEWLKTQTTVAPETVIAYGPDFVFALVPETPTQVSPGVIRRTVREEVLSATFAATMRGRSSVQVLDFDCGRRRFKPVLISIYEGNNLQGKVERLALADEWTEERAGTFMAEYIKAVCDPSFRYPLTGQTVAAIPPVPAATPTPAQPPAAPPVLRPAQPVSPRTTPAPATAAVGGAARVQVGAYASDSQARSALANLVAAFPQAAPRSRQTEPVKTATATLYRALLGGFSNAEADAFCRTVVASGRACIVRRAP